MKDEVIYLAGGCFWCIEAVYKRVKGVISVTSGYMGSAEKPPTEEQVYSRTSGFAETVKVVFNETISLEQLLEVFWAVHDPTSLNRQGNDVGPQYRSAIFFTSMEQQKIIQDNISKLEQSKKYTDPIVTAVEPSKNFFEAEKYHLNYYDNNRNQPYCRLIIDPKVQKLYKDFKELSKEIN